MKLTSKIELYKLHGQTRFALVGPKGKTGRYVSYLITKRRGMPLKYGFAYKPKDFQKAYDKALGEFSSQLAEGVFPQRNWNRPKQSFV